MELRPVVTCFLRHEGALLLLKRSEAVGSYPGTWGAVAGHVAVDEEYPSTPSRTPADAAYQEVTEETGIEGPTLVRAGETHTVEDQDLGVRWRVHPMLFEVEARDVATNEETEAVEWVHAPAILRRETVPGLWASYEAVRPRVETVRDDRTHGSTWLSLRALELLRDEAALASEDRDPSSAERADNDWDALAAFARNLRTIRPSMAVLTNRVNRAMHTATGEDTTDADERTPAAIEAAAADGIDRAVTADREAARVAAERLPDSVATLSRSGTVTAAIRVADPEDVLIAESRPGIEGVPVAEALAAALDGPGVTLTTDAAFPALIAERDVGALVVGADRILPDGDVLNKVGTRTAALSAPNSCDRIVVAASDKIAQDDAVYVDERDATELYDGDADVAVANPTFDVTPASAIDAVVTERGVLSPTSVTDIAAEHAVLSEW